jgi:preprotein translocase subunit SecA
VKLLERMGAKEGDVLSADLITRSIEQAQKRVELQNFQARKRLLEFDDVMNQQREVIYSLRAFALEGGEELKGETLGFIEKAVARRVETTLATYAEDELRDLDMLAQELLVHYMISAKLPPAGNTPATQPSIESVREAAVAAGKAAFEAKMNSFGENADRVLSLVTLNVLDEKWKDHLYDLDQLRHAIHYRSWGQKDPLIEYKQEAYTMFVDLMTDVANTFAERFLRVQLVMNPEQQERPRPPQRRFNALGVAEDIPTAPDTPEAPQRQPGDGDGSRPATAAPPAPKVVGPGMSRASALGGAAGAANKDWGNVGRNDPCPCGSGKKFKKCHGAG